jgi:hypothetical protein
LSKDNLTSYEICAGKWNITGLKRLVELVDKKDHDEIDTPVLFHNKNFYNIDILKNALNLALNSTNEIRDIKVLDILLDQIRIQHTVDTSTILLYSI